MPRDAAFGAATLLLSLVCYWMASSVPISQLADAIGPRRLPQVYALMLAALSLILIVRSIARSSSARFSMPPFLGRAAGMVAIGVLYVLVAPRLGYLLSIAGLIAATVYYQGGSFSRPALIVAISGGVFFWLLFVVVMGIQQPAGWWQ